MHSSREAAPGVAWLRTGIVNVAFVEPEPRDGRWVLVDTGLRGWSSSILAAARARHGDRPPTAIILTHGHFDHVGGLHALLEVWDVPVYAHRAELPHLTGRRAYPPPDPTVGGGVLAWSARLFPSGPIDISARLRTLPEDGSLPPLPGWRWWHTPGHTDGHVSLFRDTDRVLLSGDAVITVRQESGLAVLRQRPTLHGPPAYFTSDWSEALGSVRDLADLSPNVLVPGHGVPMSGPALTHGLRRFADRFHGEVPRQGRYVRTPARRGDDQTWELPPDPWPHLVRKGMMGAAAASALAAWWRYSRSDRRRAARRPRKVGP